MSPSRNPLHAPCIVDQKDLNEAVFTAISAVARQNVHHCAELFDMPLRLAHRFALMDRLATETGGEVDHLLDLSTTPSALWRVTMSVDDVERMQRGVLPMVQPELEPYRSILARLNEQVVLMLLRYTAQPRTAALVSGLGNHEFMSAMSTASCSTLLQSAKNLGRPLIELTINETYLDRVFCTPSGVPVDAPLRGLLARVMCTWRDFSSITQALDREAGEIEPLEAPRIGRPTAVFLPPGEADIIKQLISHGVPTKTILAFTRSKVNSAQVRRLRSAPDDAGSCHETSPGSEEPEFRRFHDSNAAVWGSAMRRLIVTSIFAHQRILVSVGLTPQAAFVEAYEHHEMHYSDPANPLSLSRLISAVFTPLRAGQVHLGHCDECGTMHLLHDSHHNGIECPVCALAKFRKLGKASSPATTARPGSGAFPSLGESAAQVDSSGAHKKKLSRASKFPHLPWVGPTHSDLKYALGACQPRR